MSEAGGTDGGPDGPPGQGLLQGVLWWGLLAFCAGGWPWIGGVNPECTEIYQEAQRWLLKMMLGRPKQPAPGAAGACGVWLSGSLGSSTHTVVPSARAPSRAPRKVARWVELLHGRLHPELDLTVQSGLCF